MTNNSCFNSSSETVPLTDYDLSPRMVLMSFSTAMARSMKETRPSSKGSRETVPLTDYDSSPHVVLMSFSTAMTRSKEKRPSSRETVPLTDYDLSPRMVLISFSTAMARPMKDDRQVGQLPI